MTTRSCSGCGHSKSIQGVWYLVTDAGERRFAMSAPIGSDAAAFVCETCFRRASVTAPRA